MMTGLARVSKQKKAEVAYSREKKNEKPAR
jgi:hypothetical protein